MRMTSLHTYNYTKFNRKKFLCQHLVCDLLDIHHIVIKLNPSRYFALSIRIVT